MTGAAVAVTQQVHVNQARNLATSRARAAGLPRSSVDRVALAASELATNLVKYAVDGLFAVAATPGGFDLLAADRGPGIRRVDECLRDGYSTTGTLGTGLGAVRRLADRFDVFSRVPQGTAVLARWHLTGADSALGVRLGAAEYTTPGETVSGDAWAVATGRGVTTLAVSDGLGHGPGAAEASAAALAHVSAAGMPDEVLGVMNDALARTRGATVAVAQIDHRRHVLRYSGVGNIAARLYAGGDTAGETLVSHPGIVGKRPRTSRSHRPAERTWSSECRLVLHTDGVSQRWSAGDWPGLLRHEPATVAGWLLGQHCRRRDDACVVVIAGGDAS
ncbi:anti-sigma regulatory factor (Ser/Thr protein kinase) [Prauserella shujinwangii]|uniref:Anti-sigma regulatory factor (Ser/Thr protein kinase) n=1 Tax=Prauserella shujinwangii TaxID=1453103 RepID=A0A2T0LZZ5_9PSEU|nr:ATP-binding protein [Prauserella shujinwangii]PRX49924.1 anti-sigma regulatory factor (Ser/Thr protein kinase) [Prauserella shujinwangii]